MDLPSPYIEGSDSVHTEQFMIDSSDATSSLDLMYQITTCNAPATIADVLAGMSEDFRVAFYHAALKEGCL